VGIGNNGLKRRRETIRLASREKTIGTHSEDQNNERQTCAVLYGLETVIYLYVDLGPLTLQNVVSEQNMSVHRKITRWWIDVIKNIQLNFGKKLIINKILYNNIVT